MKLFGGWDIGLRCKDKTKNLEHRIQTDHFKRFFNGERTTFVKTIQTAQIEKYKTHLKQIWAYMLKDKVKYGVSEDVVEGTEISVPKKEYKASALDYK